MPPRGACAGAKHIDFHQEHLMLVTRGACAWCDAAAASYYTIVQIDAYATPRGLPMLIYMPFTHYVAPL